MKESDGSPPFSTRTPICPFRYVIDLLENVEYNNKDVLVQSKNILLNSIPDLIT